MIIVSHRHCTGLKMQIVIKNVQRDLALALTISLFCVVTIKYLDITNAFHFILETKQQHSHFTVCESQDCLENCSRQFRQARDQIMNDTIGRC